MPRAPWSRGGGAAPRTVTVYEGDTLWSLAFAYGFTVDELARANGGLTQRGVRPGMRLRLPGGSGEARAGPWSRFDDGHEHRRAVTYNRDGSERRGVPVVRLALALAGGLALGALRFAPGPVGDGTRAALDKAAAAVDGAAKAVGPVAEEAARRALPFWRAALGKLGASLQALGRATSHAVIEVLGGTPGRAADATAGEEGAAAAPAALSESTRVRVELAQAQALSAAAEAARASLERELAAALAAVEALTETQSAQQALAESQAQRSRDLEHRLDAVRVAAAAGTAADA